MTKINKVLIIFFVAIFLFWLAFIQVIQSKKFASMISNKITSIASEELKAKIKFARIEFTLFPLGTVLHSVEVIDFAGAYHVQAKTISFYFNIISNFKNRVSIKNLKIEDGVFRISSNRKYRLKKGEILTIDEMRKYLDFENIQQLSQTSDSFSIYGLQLENIKFIDSSGEMHLQQLMIKIYRRFYEVSIEMKSFSSKIFYANNPQMIDRFFCRLQISPDKIRIKELELLSELNRVNATAQVKGNLSSWESMQLKGVADGEFDLGRVFPIIGRNDVTAGIGSFKMKFSGPINNLNVSFNSQIDGFVSEYAVVNKLTLSAFINQSEMGIKNLRAEHEGGSAQLKQPVIFWDLKKQVLVVKKLQLEVKKLKASTILYSIKNSLYPLQGRLTGDVDINFFDDSVQFKAINKALFDNFKLQFDISNVQTPLLANPTLQVDKLEIEWFYRKGKVTFDGGIQFPDSKIIFVGKIDENGVNFKTEPGEINLDKLGPISGMQLSGKGIASFDIKGAYEDISFIFFLDLDDAGALDFNLGKIKSIIEYRIKDNYLYFKDFTGQMSQTKYIGKGGISFKGEGEVALEMDFQQSSYKDSRVIYDVLMKKIKYLPGEVGGLYQAQYSIKGPFDLARIEVKGKVWANELEVYGEKITKARASILYKNKNIKISDINFKKGSGLIKGSYSYNLNDESCKWRLDLNRVPLNRIRAYRDFGPPAEGFLKGHVRGDNQDNGSAAGKFHLYNLRVDNIPISDSKVNFNYTQGALKVGGSFLVDAITFSSKFVFNKKSNGPKSFVEVSIDSDEVATLLSSFGKHNIRDTRIKGVISGNIRIDFDIDDWRHMDMEVMIDKFNFNRERVKLKLNRGKGRIVVSNGEIEKWDIEVKGDGLIRSVGQGSFHENFSINSFFNFDAGLAEIWQNRILNAKGMLNNKVIFSGDGVDANMYLFSASDDLFLELRGLPAVFDRVKYNLSIENYRMVVEEFSGKLGNGLIKGSGEIIWDTLLPKMDLKFRLDKVGMSFFNKTKMLVTGDGGIRGQRFPYILYGNFSILSGYIYDKFSSFSASSSKRKEINRYLPSASVGKNFSWGRYDLALNVTDGVQVQNDLVEMTMKGEGRILGDIESPKLQGRYTLVPGEGKLLFKNSDFILSRGIVTFSAESEDLNPEFNFRGLSRIGDYRVTMLVQGKVDNFAVDLSSDPPLSKEDILSLMTLGFTSDVSKNLDDSDRQSMTSVGIGSILFDRLQINQELKSSFGLRFSFAPEVAESESSYLSGRTGGDTLSSSRLKTATKIKIQKKLSKAVDMSVSSTVGGSIQSKQEMNLNYMINKNLSVEGIYEVKSSNEDIESTTTNSLGLDFKIKLNFK